MKRIEKTRAWGPGLPARLANRERWSCPCSKRHSMLLPRTVGSVDNSRDLSIRGTRPRLPTCYCVSQASPLPAWDAGGPGRPEQQPGVSLPGHECMANKREKNLALKEGIANAFPTSHASSAESC